MVEKKEFKEIKKKLQEMKLLKWTEFQKLLGATNNTYETKATESSPEDCEKYLKKIDETLTFYAKIFQAYHTQPEKRPGLIDKYAHLFTKSGFSKAQKEDLFAEHKSTILEVREQVRYWLSRGEEPEELDEELPDLEEDAVVAAQQEEEEAPDNVDEPTALFDRTHESAKKTLQKNVKDEAPQKLSNKERRAKFLREHAVGHRPRTRNVKP